MALIIQLVARIAFVHIEGRTNHGAIVLQICQIYYPTVWHEIFAGSNFCDFSCDPQK